MSRLLSGFLLFCGMIIIGLNGASRSYAASFDQYTPVHLPDLARFLVDMDAVDLKDPDTFTEYLQITACDAFKQVKDSQFRQQELHYNTLVRLQEQKKHISKSDMFISIPTTLLTPGYNFDTQSLEIIPDNQLKLVNSLQIYENRAPVCDKSVFGYAHVPIFYWVQLNFPVSLYRIPLQRNLAETLTNRLDKSRSNDKLRIIYGNVLVHIERIEPQITRTMYGQSYGFLFGQVAAIDLYVDHERRVLFKRLNYQDSY